MAQNRGWHKENIKAELRKKFGSLKAVGTALGVDIRSVSGALADPLASQLLKVRPHELWPDRWLRNGDPIARKERQAALEANRNDAA